MIVEAVHPASVAHVPVRSRKERTDLVRMRTSVVLRTVPSDAMEPIACSLEPLLEHRGTVHAHEGALWQRLGGAGPGGAFPMDRDAFAAFLEGGTGTPELTRRFVGTPLTARISSRYLGHFGIPVPERHGVEVDLDASRQLVRDTRARAGAALREMLDREVRIVGDHVYAKLKPLLSAYRGGPDGTGRTGVHLSGHLTDYVTLVASPGNAQAMLAAILDMKGTPPPLGLLGPKARAWLGAPFGDSLEGEDHALVANSHAGSVLRLLEEAMRVPRRQNECEALEVHLQAMRALEEESRTGIAGFDGVRPALLAISRAIRAVRDASGTTPVNRSCETLGRAIDGHYLATIASPAIPEGDLEALSLAR